VDLSGLRAEFPVLDRLAYLNAGTDGPLPARAVAATAEELERQAQEGRHHSHVERRKELTSELRAAYASLLGCEASEIALTTCTSDGLAQTIAGLRLSPGDEILTSDEEHPGLLGTLAAARELRGVSIREAPLEQIASAVDERSTRLVACSHVELDVPVLLDGAQGVGAIPCDVRALGCDAYAGAGQKWLCGPDGTGMLYVSPALRERLEVSRRGYANLSDPNAGLAAEPHEDGRRFDTLMLSAEALACALESVRVLERAGWQEVHTQARALAARLVELLSEHGYEVAPRGATTLVSFASEDPAGKRERLAEQGVIVRDIPNRPWLRASVGAWNDEDDLRRLLTALRG
jgi:L-cysteine/cystine lyase